MSCADLFKPKDNYKMKNMNTIKDLALEKKARKGPAKQITKKGAYWIALSIDTKRGGGDGIGQAPAQITTVFEVRHYRDGKLEAVVKNLWWHENEGLSTVAVAIPAALEVTNVEDLIRLIKSTSIPDDEMNDTFEVSKQGQARLEKDLAPLPAAAPGPDEP